MLRGAAAALAFVALLRPGAPQELKSDVLDKLKSATVYVVADRGAVRAMGSGFLFKTNGSDGYLLTCEHVVRGASKIEVVFRSGTAQESAFPALLLAADPRQDVACLLVRDVKSLPAALDLDRQTTVRETETVFAAGFPFGGGLAFKNSKRPEISIAKSSISSIRRGDDGSVTAVQISGEIHAGNSGGPLVTVEGRVIGINAAKIDGTGTAFAVPPEAIQEFLKGRAGTLKFKSVGDSSDGAAYEITMQLADPLTVLKSVGIVYIDEAKITVPIAPGKDGAWSKLDPAMKTMVFKVDGNHAEAKIDVARGSAKANELSLIYQSYYTRADDRTYWSEPATLVVKFGTSSASTDASETPKPGPPPGGPVAFNLPDELAPSNQIKMNAVVSQLYLAPDGSFLFALDLSEGQVYKINPDDLAIVARIDTIDNPVAMSMTPNGKTLYVAARNSTTTPTGPNGFLQVISTDPFKVTGSFEIKEAPTDLSASDSGLIAVSSVGPIGVFIIDASKKSSEPVEFRGRGFLRLTPDQTRFYVGDRWISPADFHAFKLTKEKGRYVGYDSPYHGKHPLGGSFEITPDGQYLLGCGGSILRLAKTTAGDLTYSGKIEPWRSLAVSSGSETFFTASSDGFIKSYDRANFELKKSVKVNLRCDLLVLDVGRRKLHAVAGKVDSGPGFVQGQLYLGRILSFSLSGK